MSKAQANLPPANTLWIDLRPQELRFTEPLERLLPQAQVQAITLKTIEQGQHGLEAKSGPVTVICERGIRSPLAAQLLQADGLDASAYAGGVPALKRALEQ